jgi:hypothetical protein
MNFRQLSGLVICAAVLVNLSSCTKSNDDKTVDAGKIQQNANLTSAQKAEQLAKAAEQLVSFQGFAYADEVADLALQNDSSNLRAQFIKAMLGPVMVNQGLAARLKPLVSKDAEALDKYNEGLADLEKDMPNSTVKTFIKNGSADIKDEKDVQDYINSIADSFKAIRIFAKNNKNSELTVMVTDALYKTMFERYKQSCEIVEISKYQYKTNCPTHTNMLEVKLNRADFEAIQMSASGYELAMSLYNSYNLTGSIDKALSLKDQKNVDGKTVIDELLQNKEFATLRAGNGFSRIKEMGLDAVSGMRWVIQNQETLCALGRSNSKNRVGMLFSEGLCSTNEKQAQKDLTTAEEALNGKLYTKELEMRDQSKYNFVIKPVALLDSPIADLRSVAPVSYDKCGNVAAIQDATVSGILVNGDANIILSKQSDCTK